MSDIDPAKYVEALRILINASSSPDGPSLDEAFRLTKHLHLPQEWIVALLFGWADYAKRYKRPLGKELIAKGSVRFLRPRLLRVLGRTDSKRRCQLCGLEAQKPAMRWHKQCWAALEKETSIGWRAICRAALLKCQSKCEHCGISLYHRLSNSTGPKYDFDHIVPLCLSGEHSANNLQVLCKPCHKIKTKTDIAKLVEKRRASKGTRE